MEDEERTSPPESATEPRAALPAGAGSRRATTRKGPSSGPFLPTELVAEVLGRDADLGRFAALLGERELAEVARYGPRRLALEAALPPRTARALAAAFALGRAVERSAHGARPRLDSPASVHSFLAPRVRGAAQEHVFALLLDARHRLRSARLVSLGTLGASLVHPREVFGPAVREGAAAVIVAHNHPSGDPTPSAEDVEVTRRLVEVAALLGIPLLDHVVVGDDGWTSLRARLPELPFGAPRSKAADST